MPALRIQVLGSFRVWRQGELVSNETWPTHKSKTLFKILLTERGHFVSADRLVEYLWPDLPPKQAQNNLWVTVSQVRRVLQPDMPRRAPSDYILTQREGYMFSKDSDYWLDVDAFRAHLEAGRQSDQAPTQIKAFEAARQLYRGDYLEEDPYEDWSLATREVLREHYLALLTNLAEAHARQGRYRRAISLCHEGLAIDNIREAVYRQLMLYHYCAGEQSLALKVYDECKCTLRGEIGVDPMPETISLYRQIQRRQVEAVDRDVTYPRPTQDFAVSYSLGRTPFVGREAEYGRLAACATEAAASRGQVVLITGEPGIGKSRLVQEVAGFAREQGMSTLFACCYQVEQAMSYQPVNDLARQALEDRTAETLPRLPAVWLAEIATLLPEITDAVPGLPAVPPDVDESRQGRLFYALARLFATIADCSGLMLAVDDIHWADPATLQFLHHLACHLADRAILLVCTYRSEEVATNEDLATFVHGLKRDAHFLQIRLARFSAEDVNALLEPMVGSSPRAMELSRWVHRETDGNPFFFVSILQSLLEQGLLNIGEEIEWHVNPQELYAAGIELTLPDALRESVRDRLRRVPKGVRRVLDLAAVLGRRFDFATLQAVTQSGQEMLLDAVEDLVARHLLHEEEDGRHYDFSHDKIREVVYHDLSGARRVLLHRQVAEKVEAQASGRLDETASILAHHFERAGERARALAYRLQAGEHALSTYAAQQAARHYERALALTEQPSEKAETYLGLGRAHFALDDLEAAVADLNQGLQLAEKRDELRARLLYLLADVHFARYDVEACESHVRAALTAAEAVGDRETMCQSLSLLGQVYSARGDLDSEIELITQALDVCRRLGDRWRQGRTLADLGWLQAQRAEFAEAVVSAERALELLEVTDDRAGMAFAWNILGRAHGGRGDYEAAFAAFQRSREVAEAIDHKFLMAQVPNMLGWLHQQLCDYERALAFDQEGVEVARRWGKTPAEIGARINLGLDILHLGDPARALFDLGEIQRKIEREAFGFHAWRWRLRLHHAQGLCYLALGHAPRALELAEEGMTLAKATTSRKYVALNHELSGMALADLGQATGAMAELKSALALADGVSYQPLRWGGRYWLARFYEQAGQGEEARANLAEAKQIIHAIATELTDKLLRSAFLGAELVRAVTQAANDPTH
jgi:predicted ATPase/DNA-binding SARP family transcriptional activator